MIYLIYTAVLGTLFYLWPGLIPFFLFSHVHAGMVGFFVNMVMGVAYWMMPRPGQLRQDRAEASTFFLLNGGLLVRLVIEPLSVYTHSAVFHPILVASAIAQLLAILVFVWAMSRRVLTSDMLRELRRKRDG